MWCPLSSTSAIFFLLYLYLYLYVVSTGPLHISNLLPLAGTSRHRHQAQRALCPNGRRGPLCLCAQGPVPSGFKSRPLPRLPNSQGQQFPSIIPPSRARESRSVRWTIWSTVNALPWKYNSSTAGVDGKEGGGETFQAGAPYCLVPPYSLGYTSPRWLPPKAVWEAMLNSAHVDLSYSEMGRNDFICMSRNETMCQLNMSVSTGEWDCVC